MKKNLLILCSLLVGLTFVACSSDNDENNGTSSTSAISVKNASFNEDAFPQATLYKRLEGVSVSTNLTADNSSTIKIAKDDEYVRFFIGIKGQSGYYVFTPNDTRAYDQDQEDEDDFWIIPFSYDSKEISGKTILVSAEDIDGDITKPYEFTINYTDSRADLYITMNGSTILSCEYDNSSRPIHVWASQIGEANEELTITYKDGKPTQLVLSDDEEITTFTTIEINEMGYITSMSGKVVTDTDEGSYTGKDAIYYNYDNNGYLTRYNESYSDEYGSESITHTLTWKDGNLVRHIIEDNDGDREEYSITYGNDANKQQQGTVSQWYSGWGILCFTNLLGKHSTNLPVSVSGEGTYQFTYEIDSDGSIKSETVNGHKLTYSYGNGTRVTNKNK